MIDNYILNLNWWGNGIFFMYFLVYVMVEEKCLKIEDIKIEMGGFISCVERIIIVKGF